MSAIEHAIFIVVSVKLIIFNNKSTWKHLIWEKWKSLLPLTCYINSTYLMKSSFQTPSRPRPSSSWLFRYQLHSEILKKIDKYLSKKYIMLNQRIYVISLIDLHFYIFQGLREWIREALWGRVELYQNSLKPSCIISLITNSYIHEYCKQNETWIYIMWTLFSFNTQRQIFTRFLVQNHPFFVSQWRATSLLFFHLNNPLVIQSFQ